MNVSLPPGGDGSSESHVFSNDTVREGVTHYYPVGIKISASSLVFMLCHKVNFNKFQNIQIFNFIERLSLMYKLIY